MIQKGDLKKKLSWIVEESGELYEICSFDFW